MAPISPSALVQVFVRSPEDVVTRFVDVNLAVIGRAPSLVQVGQHAHPLTRNSCDNTYPYPWALHWLGCLLGCLPVSREEKKGTPPRDIMLNSCECQHPLIFSDAVQSTRCSLPERKLASYRSRDSTD